MDRLNAFFSKVLLPGTQHRILESTVMASASLASNSADNNGFSAFPIYPGHQATEGMAAA
jgi:hypothetical protein